MNAVPGPLEIGLCSWSLGVGSDARALQAQVERFGLRLVHLALGPLVDAEEPRREEAVAALRALPLVYSAGMIAFSGEDYTTLATIRETGGYVPEGLFNRRLAQTVAAARVAQELGLGLLTVHAGFIPEKSERPRFDVMVDRVRRVADGVGECGVTLALETGQEAAETLADFLEAVGRANLAVNFDPANLILYGSGDPINAAVRLGSWIRHVHAKDARRILPAPEEPAWKGVEVPVGTGDGRLAELVSTLWRVGYRGALAVECEKGRMRGKSIALGVSCLKEARRRVGT